MHAGNRRHRQDVDRDDRGVAPAFSRSTCVQLPGAAPKSAMRIPGRSSLSFAASSISLNAARDLYPSLVASLTQGSLTCSPSTP
jgi:hypothetical protein